MQDVNYAGLKPARTKSSQCLPIVNEFYVRFYNLRFSFRFHPSTFAMFVRATGANPPLEKLPCTIAAGFCVEDCEKVSLGTRMIG